MDWNIIVPSIIGLLSAVTVALLENWDKINPDKKRIREMLQTVTDTKQEVDNLTKEMDRMQSAQRTALQTQILQACKNGCEVSYESDCGQSRQTH